ncbi:MAG: glutathione S-transferase [Pseudomonadota bacterium]
MKYRLHNRLGSGGFAVQATLAAADIDFEYEPIASKPNQPLGPKIRDLNGWGQVPVLELADGTRLPEVAAILIHLSYEEADVRAGPHLWIDDHPNFLRWSVFLAVNVYEGILRKTYTERFFHQRSGEAPNGTPGDVDELIAGSVRLAATKRTHEAFLCIEEETAEYDFLLSDRMSPCDILLAMLYAWHNLKPDLPKCTWITTKVATHPKIQPIWRQNFHDRLDFHWHEL